MKHIVTLSHSPFIGGGELALKSLIESTIDTYKWTIIIPSSIPADPQITPEGVTVINLPSLPWWCYEAHDHPAPVDQRELESSLKVLRKIASSADLLLTNTITIPWLGFIAQELQKPHIWYVHEYGNLDHNLQFIAGYETSLKIIEHCSSRIMTISNAVKNHIGSVISPNKIDIIHQSIDIEELSQIPPVDTPKELRLLCLGAVKPSKGQMVALEAVSQLPDLRLDIIGPAADQKYATLLENKAASISNVHVDVRRYNPIDELTSHNILLMCSENEALGRVTLEGLAAGRVVVGYASQSTTELLDESRGFLYSPNTTQSLKGVLENLPNALPTFKASKGRQYVLDTFSNKAQASDFSRVVSAGDETSPQSTSELDKYLHLLHSSNLWLTQKDKALQKMKGAIPRPLKHFMRRIIRH